MISNYHKQTNKISSKQHLTKTNFATFIRHNFFCQTYHHFNVTKEDSWDKLSPWQCLRSQGWEGEARATVCHSASKCTRDWDIETHPMRAILISHLYYAAYTLLELCMYCCGSAKCLQARNEDTLFTWFSHFYGQMKILLYIHRTAQIKYISTLKYLNLNIC